LAILVVIINTDPSRLRVIPQLECLVGYILNRIVDTVTSFINDNVVVSTSPIRMVMVDFKCELVSIIVCFFGSSELMVLLLTRNGLIGELWSMHSSTIIDNVAISTSTIGHIV